MSNRILNAAEREELDATKEESMSLDGCRQQQLRHEEMQQVRQEVSGVQDNKAQEGGKKVGSKHHEESESSFDRYFH